MSGLGILGDPRVVTFSGRVLRYDTDTDMVVSGAMGSVTVNIGPQHREYFKVDVEVIVTVAAVQVKQMPGRLA